MIKPSQAEIDEEMETEAILNSLPEVQQNGSAVGPLMLVVGTVLIAALAFALHH